MSAHEAAYLRYKLHTVMDAFLVSRIRKGIWNNLLTNKETSTSSKYDSNLHQRLNQLAQVNFEELRNLENEYPNFRNAKGLDREVQIIVKDLNLSPDVYVEFEKRV